MAKQGAIDITDLNDALIDYFSSSPTIPINEDMHVKQLISKFKISEEFLSQFGYINTNIPYTRNLISSTTYFDLILLCWNGGQCSPIHAHAGSNCWLSVLKGNLTESFYAPPSSPPHNATDNDTPSEPIPLIKLSESIIHEGTIAYINDNLGLHAMGNASPIHSDTAYSLHVYSPPYQSVAVFDEQGNKSVRHIHFHTKYGEKTDM